MGQSGKSRLRGNDQKLVEVGGATSAMCGVFVALRLIKCFQGELVFTGQSGYCYHIPRVDYVVLRS